MAGSIRLYTGWCQNKVGRMVGEIKGPWWRGIRKGVGTGIWEGLAGQVF